MLSGRLHRPQQLQPNPAETSRARPGRPTRQRRHGRLRPRAADQRHGATAPDPQPEQTPWARGTKAFACSCGRDQSKDAHDSTAILDLRARRSPSPDRSGSQYLVEDALGLEFVGALGKRQLGHQNLPGLRQHSLLAGRQARVRDHDATGHALPRQPCSHRRKRASPSLPCTGGTSSSALRCAEPATPRRRDPAGPVDNVANADDLGVVSGDLYSEVALGDLEDQIKLLDTLDGPSFGGLDECCPVVGVDNGFSNIENHERSRPLSLEPV